ncbi:hypothetical protein MXD58_018055, partial [Frankia sp. AgKG'84/4]|nr:hypothetical protein [Frankia sp. AgKG'84/4]
MRIDASWAAPRTGPVNGPATSAAEPLPAHPRGSSPGAQLARLGFTDVERVAATMGRLGLLPTAGAAGSGSGVSGSGVSGGGAGSADAVAAANPVVAALAAAADPDLALAALERLVDALGPVEGPRLLAAMAREDGLRARLSAVLGASRALGFGGSEMMIGMPEPMVSLSRLSARV